MERLEQHIKRRIGKRNPASDPALGYSNILADVESLEVLLSIGRGESIEAHDAACRIAAGAILYAMEVCHGHEAEEG